MTTKTEAKHTPLPWEAGAFGTIMGHKEGNGIPQDFIAQVQPLNGYDSFVHSEKAKANRDIILRAVNCHEELLKALRLIVGYSGHGKTVEERLTIAKAAILKVEGK